MHLERKITIKFLIVMNSLIDSGIHESLMDDADELNHPKNVLEDSDNKHVIYDCLWTRFMQ